MQWANLLAVPALCALFVLTVSSMSNGAESDRAKKVLIISTGSRLAPGFIIADQQLLAALRKIQSPRIEIFAENLDLVRFPNERYQQIFRDYLSAKYNENRPDLVILIYTGNLGLAGPLLPQLFPNTPVIVAGFSEEELHPEQFGKLVSGLAQRVNPQATLELIRRLQPEVNRVIVIGGTAETDQQVTKRIRDAAQRFESALKIEFWDNFTMDELIAAVKLLPAETAILFGRMFRDAAGQALTSSEVARTLGQEAKAPVYVMTETGLGTGAVGGALASIEAFGQRAGELARLVLTSPTPQPLSFEVRTDTVPTFDWRALKRWAIPESRLPPNSIVRFRPQSYWQEYRFYIIAAFLIILLQSIMIVDLLLQRRRRRQVETELRESRELMELAASAGELGLWSRDLTAKEIWVNAPMRSLFGFGANETVTFERIQERIHPDDRHRMLWEVKEARIAGLPFEGEFRVVLPDGTDRWLLAKGRTIADPGSGSDARRMGTIVDISERKRAEEKLRESEQNFRRLVETTSAVLWQADVRTWQFTYVGPQASRLLGYPLEQWYEKDFWVSHLHPDDREQAVNTCMRMSENTDDFEFEYRMIRASGEVVWIHDVVNCQHHDGTAVHIRGLMLDITGRKRAEEMFRSAIEASPNAILMVDERGRILLVNAQGEKLFRYARDELLGQSVEMLVPERVRAAHAAHRADFLIAPEARAMGAGQELFGLCKDGSEVPIEIGLSPVSTDQGLITLTTIVDISEHKRNAEALIRERKFLRQVIDTDPNLIFAKDGEGRFTLANKAVAETYGTTVDNLIGKTDADFNPNESEVDSFRQMDMEVLNTLQERFIPEERITNGAGAVRWLQTMKRPIIEMDGSKQVLGVSTDITHHKKTEAELREQRMELAHVARISTMGELAASLAHELNQPLTAILSNAQAALRFLSSKPADIEEVRETLHDIIEDNNRAGEVIRRMRALVKKEEVQFVSLNLSILIHDVVGLVHSDAILLNTRILLLLNDNVPTVLGDKVQLQQVVLNLLLNAFDAMKDYPPLEREVKVQVEPYGADLKVTVSDRGVGLSMDKLDKIFEPFYTTKGEGLGMGLSICRSIIEAHGGHLWAENNPDRGATFCFTVPIEGYPNEKLRETHPKSVPIEEGVTR